MNEKMLSHPIINTGIVSEMINNLGKDTHF